VASLGSKVLLFIRLKNAGGKSVIHLLANGSSNQTPSTISSPVCAQQDSRRRWNRKSSRCPLDEAPVGEIGRRAFLDVMPRIGYGAVNIGHFTP